MATLHGSSGGAQVLFAKGAPEVILDHCDRQETKRGEHAPILISACAIVQVGQFEVRLIRVDVVGHPASDDAEDAARGFAIANRRPRADGDGPDLRTDDRDLHEHVPSDPCDAENIELPANVTDVQRRVGVGLPEHVRQFLFHDR